MFEILLLPTSITYLVQIILLTTVMTFFVERYRQKQETPATRAFALFVFSLLLLACAWFGESSLVHAPRVIFLHLINPVFALGQFFLIRFAYYFPAFQPTWQREAQIVQGLALGRVGIEVWTNAYAIYRLTQGQVEGRFWLDLLTLAEFVWAVVVLLRQARRLAQQKKPRLGTGHLPFQTHTWQVVGIFAGLFLPVVTLIVLYLLNTDPMQKNLITSLGVLFCIAGFLLAYIYLLPETTSFLIKLMSVFLTLTLVLLGVVGWIVPTALLEVAPALVPPPQQTIHFVPNPLGGYTLQVTPTAPNTTTLGHALDLTGVSTLLPLPFAFPFFGETQTSAYISPAGYLTFKHTAPAFETLDVNFNALSAIFALSHIPHLGVTQVFLRQTPKALQLTWVVPAINTLQPAVTAQIILYPSGAIQLSHLGYPATPNNLPYIHPAGLIGISPGSPSAARWAVLNQTAAQVAPREMILESAPHALRHSLHIFLAPLALLIGLSSLFIWQASNKFFASNLMRPLENLLVGVKQLKSGDYGVRVPVRFQDEIGTLTASFNHLASSLESHIHSLEAEVAERRKVENELRHMQDTLVERVADQSRYLNALYEMLHSAEEVLDESVLLAQALVQLQTALHAQALCVHLQTAETAILHTHCGLPPEAVAQLTTLPATWFPPDRKPHWVEQSEVQARTGFAACLSAPLAPHATQPGYVAAFWATPPTLPVEDLALFGAFANQLGLLRESVLWRERSLELAALNERRRLGRDLHDSVTQSLHGLTFITHLAQQRLQRGQFDRVKHSLEQITQSAQQALKETRLLLYELRPPALDPATHLSHALHLRLEAVEQRAGVTTELVAPAMSLWPQEWEHEAYAIALEALNNALKHAQATQVRVVITGDAQSLEMVVQDNGRGFIQTSASVGWGLGIMRERAERLGGELQVVSTPDIGTQVMLRIARATLLPKVAPAPRHCQL